MLAKAFRQQPRSTLISGVSPEPAAGQKLLDPEQATVVEPHAVPDRPHVVLGSGITPSTQPHSITLTSPGSGRSSRRCLGAYDTVHRETRGPEICLGFFGFSADGAGMGRECIFVQMIPLGSIHPFVRRLRLGYGMTSHPSEGKNEPPTTCGTIRGPIGTIGISYSTRSTTPGVL